MITTETPTEPRRELPNEWDAVPLGEAGEIASGVTLGRKFFNEPTRQVPYLRVANVKDGYLDLSDVYSVEVPEREITKLRLQYGDLLLTEGGDPDKLGRGTFWKEQIAECVHQNHIFRVRLDLAKFDPEFVSLQLQSHYGKAYFLKHAKQTTGIATINQKALSGFPLLFPPFPEQRRIAALLNKQMVAVDRARAAAEARLEAARALPAAYLREAFCGITPLAARKERDQAPPGWKWHRLKDLARLESGHTPSRRRPEWWGGDIPWIALPDIRALDGKIAEQTSEYTNEEGIANSAARVLPAGTVVLSRTASVGFVTMMGRPMATSQDFVNWVCGPELEPHFLAYLLRAARSYIRALGEGAVHKTVYFPTVEAFEVCIPQPPEQKRIVASLDHTLLAVEQGFSTLQTQLASIESLPAALLRQAFSGEL